MKSPFTGKEMKQVHEIRTWNFRGESFEYHYTGWMCEDTGEQFTTDASDTAGFVQVTNQYREKYGIPYTDEIVAARKRYGISAAKMSLVLGIGTNQYRLYEQGEVPSVSNGRLIRSITNPKVMLEMVESSKNVLTAEEYAKITKRIKDEITNHTEHKIQLYETNRVYSSLRGKQNGYAPLSLPRLENVMLYIIEHTKDVWCTKMNKLLFYIDFQAYQELGMSITGLSYKAIDFGPVPERWDVVYSEFPTVHQELRRLGEYEGSVLVASSKADPTLFSEAEWNVMKTVCDNLGTMSARDISLLSHKEEAWLRHHENHAKIPFEDAFLLKGMLN